MQFRFEDVDENTLELDAGFLFKVDQYRRRVNIQKRYGKDGGVVFGDQKVDSRGIKFDFQTAAETDTAYLAILNDIIGFFKPENQPFYLVDTDNNRRCKVVLNSLSDEPEADGTEWLVGKGRLDIEMLDGHWEDDEETIVSAGTVGMDTNDILIVDNEGDIDCFPIFYIEPFEQILEFTIRNLTTGAAFTLSSNSFIPGSQFVVNCQTGTIYLFFGDSQIESSNSLADGSGFIKLVSGENQILFSSVYGSITMDVEFRKRYAF